MNSVLVVARKEFEDAIRSRGVLFISVLFVALFLAQAYFTGDAASGAAGGQGAGNAAASAPSDSRVTESFLIGSRFQTAFLVPLVAVVASYRSIIGERSSGTLKLLLSLPHSRRDALVGKLLGRTGVVCVPVVVGLVLAVPVFLAFGVVVDPLPYLGYIALTALLGAVFVGLAVGVSAAASTDRRAALGSIGTYVFLAVLWNNATSFLALRSALPDGVDQSTVVELVMVLKALNPLNAYRSLVSSLLTDMAVAARLDLFGRTPLGIGGFARQLAAQQLQREGVPVYLTDPAVVAALLLWAVLPLLVGYRLFREADL